MPNETQPQRCGPWPANVIGCSLSKQLRSKAAIPRRTPSGYRTALGGRAVFGPRWQGGDDSPHLEDVAAGGVEKVTFCSLERDALRLAANRWLRFEEAAGAAASAPPRKRLREPT